MTSIGMVAIQEEDGLITSLRLSEKEADTGNSTLDEAFGQLDEYLDGTRRSFDLEYRLDGTDFQKDVWTALTRIPYGRTVSYTGLAEMSGHPGACRAAGNASGRNPIPILIPCHRVIRDGGGIGGYSLGTDLKTRLLRLEGAIRST